MMKKIKEYADYVSSGGSLAFCALFIVERLAYHANVRALVGAAFILLVLFALLSIYGFFVEHKTECAVWRRILTALFFIAFAAISAFDFYEL